MTREDCPNPFCDGYGNIDSSPSITGRSWMLGACTVSAEHPPQPEGYRFPQKRTPKAVAA